jgi:hypothetical protein
MFRVTVVEIPEKFGLDEPKEVKRFEQTVDALDMRKVIDAINYKPRGPRVRKPNEQK